MKTDINTWTKATENLNKRRQRSVVQLNVLSDYRSHLDKCGVGKTLLDVGCGSQYLKKVLPDGVKYYGLDAFPIDGIDCFECAIEDFKGHQFDTVCAFAVLDNCRDFFQACESMKAAANQNIIILTGIGIDVDQYHTFRLEHEHFTEAFKGWDCTHREELQPKVWLLCYQRSV